MTREAMIRRKARRLQNMKFCQSTFARNARLNRAQLSMFLGGHIALREDQLDNIEKAIRVVVRKRLESLRALLPTDEIQQ